MLPLDVATGPYTITQLAAQLRRSAGASSVRFDVNNMPGITALTTVTACTIDMNVDMAIKGGLNLTMEADDALRTGAMFRARINPWYQLRMPDGGIAEWPMGSYLWTRPKRQVTGGRITGINTPPEQWTLQLGDLTHILDLSGPGIGGFTAVAGSVTTDVMARVLAAAGFTDTTGVVPSTAALGADLTFDITNPANQPTTWLTILTQLCTAIGYYSPWCDLTGRIRCIPAPAGATTDATMNYTSGTDGITVAPLDTDQSLASIGNRVYNRAKNANGFYATTVSDANVLFPAHELAQRNTGVYVDQLVDDSTAGSVAALQANGDRQLMSRLGWYETATLNTYIWPVHEAYEIVGVQVAGDPVYNATVKHHERNWTINPIAGTMQHQLSRIS